MDKEQFRKELVKLRSTLPKLREMGPVSISVGNGMPDVVITAEETEAMLNDMEQIILKGELPTHGYL